MNKLLLASSGFHFSLWQQKCQSCCDACCPLKPVFIYFSGPLLKYIEKKKVFTENEASQVVRDIASALDFLHKKGKYFSGQKRGDKNSPLKLGMLSPLLTLYLRFKIIMVKMIIVKIIDSSYVKCFYGIFCYFTQNSLKKLQTMLPPIILKHKVMITRGFKSLHWVAFLNIRRTLDFRIHLSNLIKKGLHGSAFSFSIYQVKILASEA